MGNHPLGLNPGLMASGAVTLTTRLSGCYFCLLQYCAISLHTQCRNNVKIRVFSVLQYCAIALHCSININVKIPVFSVLQYCAKSLHIQCRNKVKIRVFSVLQYCDIALHCSIKPFQLLFQTFEANDWSNDCSEDGIIFW